MVLEFADGGDLCAHLKSHFADLTWKEKYKLGLDIANGLGYLHVLNIVHKDLVRCYLFIIMQINNDLNSSYSNTCIVFCKHSHSREDCKDS